MSEPKINITKADSFKEAYDLAPDAAKEQIEEHAIDYYTDKIGKLIKGLNPMDTVFIINAFRFALVALECFSPDDFKLAYQLLPEDMLQVIKYAVQEDREYDRNQN